MANVRYFQNTDREFVRKICADTAFFGDPVEVFFDDRELYNDAFFSYYTDYEPEHFLVVAEMGDILGYLSGCFDTNHKKEINRKKIYPRILKRLVLGKYHIGGKTLSFLYRVFITNDNKSVDLSGYPAHIHINLTKESRGKGLGHMLMEDFLSHATESNIPGVHIDTTNQNTAAIHLYEKFGFRILAWRETKAYGRRVPKPVFSIVYGRKL